ncbi:hypothetical protein [Pseudomonas aeruginosa]|uniref:hypothetical protein n=1 Tax=Pseudomonas aeruginosa TaxID=287 RepID=UPI0015963FEA|nr:hypothetical protein [Pseudomonas aeruginosa]
MTDLNRLKVLAEKLAPAYQEPWESHRHSASAVTVGAVGEDGEYSDFIDVRISDYSAFDEHDDELGQWIAANPQAVLGLIAEVERLEAELSQCASALPGTYYMDPPDGGNVSIPEQIRRMAKDAARYRWLRDLPEDSPHEQIGNFPGWMWDEAIDNGMEEGQVSQPGATSSP